MGVFEASGLRLGVSLVPDAPEIMVSEPSYVTLELHNAASAPIEVRLAWRSRDALGRPENYRIEARRYLREMGAP